MGARTQPYLTLLVTGKASEGSPLSRTHPIMPSWNWLTIVMNLVGQPHFSMIFQSPSQLTVSKAATSSRKNVWNSIVDQTFLLELMGGKDHVSGPLTFTEATLALRKDALVQVAEPTIERTQARTLPALDRRDKIIPRWLLQN